MQIKNINYTVLWPNTSSQRIPAYIPVPVNPQ